MKKFNKKYLVLLASVALLLTVSVGSTVAYLVDKADEVVNIFTPTRLETDVVETFGKVDDVMTKSSIKIRNDGNIDAYVRVFITGNWVITEKDKNGNEVDKIVAPWDGNITLNPDRSWILGSDGYYYYTKRLPPTPDDEKTDRTSELLGSAITQSGGPAGAHLVINVIHQSIQADGVNANNVPVVTAVWGATVDENGNISK